MTALATKTREDLDLTKQADKSKSSGSRSHLRNTVDDSRSQMDKEHFETRSQTVAPQLHKAKVKRAELILFTTQLSVMLDSGVVLSDALDAIAEQAEHGAFKAIIMDVAETVKSGENFSKALTDYPRVFNSMFISMVRASEASGRMAEMLTVLSGYLNFESETRKRIKGALTYPFIMALMAVAATGTLMFFVLP